jgi:hypothetical protein
MRRFFFRCHLHQHPQSLFSDDGYRLCRQLPDNQKEKWHLQHVSVAENNRQIYAEMGQLCL